MEDDQDYPADRLAELLSAVDDDPRLARDARDASPELVEAIRASATAWFVEWPEEAQIEFLGRITDAERDDLLAELPGEVRRRLLGESVHEVGIEF